MSDATLGVVRRLATARGFRHLTRFQPLLRLSFALRASVVRERLRFVVNELRRRPVTAVYRLRDSGVAVAIRHHSGDVLVLDEIFSQGEYEPPEPARAVLEALSAPTVADLGANIGLFGAWALGRFPHATIVGVEADPANAAVHRRTIEANGLASQWKLIEGFAGTEAGVARFAGGEYATSHADEREGAIDVPAVDVFPELENADVVKIDIEGAEWDILADPRFPGLRPRVVVLEYHEARSPAVDPRNAAENALRAAGLDVIHAGSKPHFGAGIVWGLARPDCSPQDDADRVTEHT